MPRLSLHIALAMGTGSNIRFTDTCRTFVFNGSWLWSGKKWVRHEPQRGHEPVPRRVFAVRATHRLVFDLTAHPDAVNQLFLNSSGRSSKKAPEGPALLAKKLPKSRLPPPRGFIYISNRRFYCLTLSLSPLSTGRRKIKTRFCLAFYIGAGCGFLFPSVCSACRIFRNRPLKLE